MVVDVSIPHNDFLTSDDIKNYIKNNLLELREDAAEDEIIKLTEKNNIKGDTRKVIQKYYKAEKKEHDILIKTLEEQNEEKPDLKSVYSGIITANDWATRIQQIKEHIVSDWLSVREDEALIFIKEICEAFDLDTELKGILKKFYKAEKIAFEEGKPKTSETNDGNILKIDLDEESINEEAHTAAKEKALDILKNGNPIKFVLDTIQKRHVGDDVIQEAICLSIAGQSCLNTGGIQIGVNGAPGSGKSHGLKIHLMLVRQKHKIEASLSAKALYYAKIQQGTIVFSDDTSPSEELEDTIKRATTNYQQYTTHISVKEHNGITLQIPPRTNWYLTSVESANTTQLLSRQFKGNTIDTQAQRNAITKRQLEAAVNGEYGLTDIDDDVLVCRYIYDEIKSNVFRVTSPFASKITIIDNRDPRNTDQFADMIKGYAVFNFMQRETDDNGRLVATIEDFNNANILYSNQLETAITKYTDKETAILKHIFKHGPCTIADIATKTEIPDHVVRRTLNGRPDRPMHGGLMGKVKGLTTSRETHTDSTTNSAHSTTADYYRLESYDNWEGFNNKFATLCE